MKRNLQVGYIELGRFCGDGHPLHASDTLQLSQHIKTYLNGLPGMDSSPTSTNKVCTPLTLGV